MELFEAISGRRSIRKYSEKPVEHEKLNKVLEAARLAPSAANGQSWRFIAVMDKEKRDKLMEACYGQAFVSEAPVVLVACGLDTKVMTSGHRVDTVNLSIGMSFVMLEAYEQGLGTCWLARYDEDKVRAVLGIPDTVGVVVVMPLGYPAENPSARSRKAFDEVVRYDEYRE
jgi:nitroreductase